jgi:hypothetical protein
MVVHTPSKTQEDYVSLDGVRIYKPFVEKPAVCCLMWLGVRFSVA